MNIITKFVGFFRSQNYILYATGMWLLSFLIISGSQKHNNFTYLILLLPTLLTLQLSEIRKFFQHTIAQWLSACIGFLVLSAYINNGEALSQFKFGLIVLLFFIAISRLPIISQPLAEKVCFAFLILIIFYIGLNMAWQSFHGGWEFGNRLGELSSKLENINYAATTMGAISASLLYFWMHQRKFGLSLIILMIVFAIGMTILQSRTTLLVAMMIALLFGTQVFMKKEFQSLRNPFLISIAVIILAILLVYLSPIGESLMARKTYRLEIWQGYFLETLKCGAWLGCGNVHDFRYVSHDGIVMVHPHNIFLTQFYKSGILGFFSLIGLTLSSMYYCFKYCPWIGWYLCVGLVGLSLDGSSLIHSPSQRWLLFHLPIAILLSQLLKQSVMSSSNKFSNNSV